MNELSDVDFLKLQDQWPYYPLCAVKHSHQLRADGFPKLGFVMAAKPTVVWLGNMFAAMNDELDLDALESEKYESIEALVADGWIVD